MTRIIEILRDTDSPATDGVHVLSGETWLKQVVGLHFQVRAEMPDSQRHFLLPKKPEYFGELLNGKTGVLLGAFVEGQLAGFMAVTRSENFAAAHAENRITCPDDDGKLAKAFGDGAVAVGQSMCALVAHMGRGISRTLIQNAAVWARQNDCAHLFAQVADQNITGWMRFMEQNFAVIATWESGHRRFLLRHMSAEERAEKIRHAVGQHVYRKDYAQIPALVAEINAKLEHGYIAFLDDKPAEAGAMHFVFSRGCQL